MTHQKWYFENPYLDYNKYPVFDSHFYQIRYLIVQQKTDANRYKKCLKPVLKMGERIHSIH